MRIIAQRFIFGARCLKRGRIEMNRKMNLALVLLAAFAGMVLAAGFISCSKKDGGATASASSAATPEETFNLDLPLTYNVPTAIVQMLGLPQLSAKSLFDEANFLTSTTGEGSAVVCESKEAKDGTFTGVLLLSIDGK
jgi:ABC-type oligopeptide transport system substrate-binding subunit